MTDIGRLLITEFFGTAILITLGNGIVANVVLKGTKAQNVGWLSICIGWGTAVFTAAIISSAFKGGQGWLNPAVMLAAAFADFDGIKNAFAIFNNGEMVGILIGVLALEIFGAILGSLIVDIVYINHIKLVLNDKSDLECKGTILGMHSTGPTDKSMINSFLMEFVATAVLVTAILAIGQYGTIPKFFVPIIVGAIVIGIGLSLGGTTGYAINPARDLGPRIVHQLLPLKGKGGSDWKYSWVPIAAPMSAGLIIGLIFSAL
ncbi:glycerol uptake facilitator protein [Williamsoniiplasma somnilux]|uniref:Glycerol uptake facilitator protein n=1 Tax=Williamsoniiplasma somnilux TaxID=215578 RepID=A0A2K8NXZ8_9MOLU|nr:MIP/aquaporin family protein [Williamsoniiplasma somnilux]ATZ18426.1 glycerol uptake facilitator protein [Williamsoniiplasma somnilux]